MSLRNNLVKYSKANAKLRKLSQALPVPWKRGTVYSLDLLSGHACPFAKDCLAKAVPLETGKRHIVTGKDAIFRCFSASQEAQYTQTYNMRSSNFEKLRACKTVKALTRLIHASLPPDAAIVRIHVGGDFYAQNYFDAWLDVARLNPDRLFYAYTKSLGFWVKRVDSIPENLVLTASEGGSQDHLIAEHNLRSCVVVYSETEAREQELPIDHDDSHAANPAWRDQRFALLIHGTQPKGSEAQQAMRALKGVGSYNRTN
tara:strand:+ start:643 stop:1416 length:774 start_codon:yes stop_codon:yes gene_type:complete